MAAPETRSPSLRPAVKPVGPCPTAGIAGSGPVPHRRGERPECPRPSRSRTAAAVRAGGVVAGAKPLTGRGAVEGVRLLHLTQFEAGNACPPPPARPGAAV